MAAEQVPLAAGELRSVIGSRGKAAADRGGADQNGGQGLRPSEVQAAFDLDTLTFPVEFVLVADAQVPQII
jgi:hypothetical protein